MKINKKDFGQERHLFLTVKQVDQQNPNIVHATVSTDEVDRYQEVIKPEAFKEALPSFLVNPVVLPAHQNRLSNGDPPVIGNVVTTSIRIHEHGVDMDIEFDDDELGQKYARKYQKKMMHAFSIGFRGLEGEDTTIDGIRVWIWTKIELLEVSPVAVPANRGALARAKGYFEPDDLGDAVKAMQDKFDARLIELKAEMLQRLNDHIDEIKSIIIAERGGLAERLLEGDPEPAVEGGDIELQFKRIQKLF